MIFKSTHIFKTVGSLKIQIDVYTRTFDTPGSHYSIDTPVILFFHGGGLVSHDRRLLPPHIVQSSLKRGWPLVSADYRLFPQVNAVDLIEDLRDAYAFVRNKLPKILGIGTGSMKNIIVAGSSAGAFITYQAGHYLDPRPLALLAYYGHPTSDDDFFRSNKILIEPPVTYVQIKHFLEEPVHCGFTHPSSQFDPKCLLDDLSPNPEWKRPEQDSSGSIPRDHLFFYLNQNNKYPEMAQGIDKSLNDPSWKDYPPTIIVHGDADYMVPLQASKDIVSVIGPTPAKLFSVPGAEHAFDGSLFLGDPGLIIVEKAWDTLDEVVKASAQ